ncbi:MAG: tRNA epoxyqueuosine(34) reductase QueG [Nevskiaceae bacterium]|nr:MAG: tRNA epoxyqueuosine(34) reductase QueG [Nevskiaceae bacterium]TBR71764.1 MAG: tRNA epoxyqueuosine(34) reductase QueG [Nevskiaceae bacterium]
MDADELNRRVHSSLQAWAAEAGFDRAGVAHLALGDDLTHLRTWLAAGRHANMAWIARDPEMRATPARLRPGTVSVISARMPCNPPASFNASEVLADGRHAYIARYALGREYHKLMRKRLLQLAKHIADTVAPHGYRVLTDSAPVLEKALARNAGLSWFGKHTLTIDRDIGSSFLLGEIYTDLPLQPTATPREAGYGCGKCTACIDVCPTHAIIAPYQLDAGRCISYLTIEHHGPIPLDMRPLIGNRIFGCDDCQLACPWNRHAQPSHEVDFKPRHGLENAWLVDLFEWDEATWLKHTEGMALRRTGYRNWLRNIAVALGNAPPDARIDAVLARHADHPDELVREHVRWAQAHRARQPAQEPTVSAASGTLFND